MPSDRAPCTVLGKKEISRQHLDLISLGHKDKESAKSSLALVSGDAGVVPDFSKLLLPRRFL